MAAVAAGSTTIPDQQPTGPAFPAPFVSTPGPVRPEWIDNNGHLNLAYYIVLFDEATDALWAAIGLGDCYRAATNCGTFAVETHTLYKSELLEGDTTTARSLVLGADTKRLHIAHELVRERDRAIAARQELLYLTVDLTLRRSVPWPQPTLATLQAAAAAHATLPRPDWIGRSIALPTSR